MVGGCRAVFGGGLVAVVAEVTVIEIKFLPLVLAIDILVFRISGAFRLISPHFMELRQRALRPIRQNSAHESPLRVPSSLAHRGKVLRKHTCRDRAVLGVALQIRPKNVKHQF